MSSSSRPSIFTSKEAFRSHTKEPPHQRASIYTPRTSSPFRRQSTPDALERGFIAEAAPLVLQLPENRLARALNAGIGKGVVHGSESSFDTTLWDSFKVAYQSEGISPGNRAAKGRSASVSHLSPDTPRAEVSAALFGKTVEGQSKKRPANTPAEERAPTSEPSHKRPRLRPGTKHFLPGYKFSASDLKRGVEPPSPLFFSNSPQPRPSLPPRFSSSEAAARMLSKARTEDTHVKTVSLARGVVSTPGQPPLTPTTGAAPSLASSRRSLDRSTVGRSACPDPASSKDMSSVLNSIGVIELLDQDERPTFIVDLADSTNYRDGILQPLFVNQSLRAHAGLEWIITGNAPTEGAAPGSQTFSQFKSWLLSVAANGESLAVCPPSFVYSNVTWSCSTLRKRLRIISGSFLATPSRVHPPSSGTSLQQASNGIGMATASAIEPADYFGASQLPADTDVSSESSSPGPTTIVPTIEHPGHTVPQRIFQPTTTRPDSNMTDALMYAHPDLSEATALLPSPSTYVPSPTKRGSDRSPRASSVDRDSSHIPVVPADFPSFDWTRLPVTDSMPPHIRFARSIDWASTALGPIELWSSDLRQMCNLIMASPHPAAM